MLQTFQVIDTKRMKWKLKLVSDDIFQEKNFFRVTRIVSLNLDVHLASPFSYETRHNLKEWRANIPKLEEANELCRN